MTVRPWHIWHSLDPNHLAYFNLFPTYATNAQLGTTGDTVTAYNAYLSQYVNTVSPSLISYDHYTFMATYDDSQYLQNLGLVANAAKQANVPFMNVVQACTWDNTFRLPNANQMRYQVYTTLAYGAQSICYFDYSSDPNGNPNSGGVKPAADGTPSPIYTTLQTLNPEFVKIASQFQHLKWIGTYLKGYRTGAMPPGTTALPGTGSPFSISNVTNISYRDGAPLQGVLLGFFDSDGTALSDATVALVTNLNYSAQKTCRVTGPGNLSLFDATTGVWIPQGHNYVDLTLAPGGGALVGLTSVASLIPEPGSIVVLLTGLPALLACVWLRSSFRTLVCGERSSVRHRSALTSPTQFSRSGNAKRG